MASTFENNLRLEEIGTGEQSGTWGTKTNVNLELITDGLSYSSTGEAIANAAAHTITMADGVADEFRSFYLKCTGGGQACTVTLAPNTLSKVWVIENTTSYTLTFSQGSGANVAILAGQVKMIATDGAGSGAAVFDLMQDLAVPDLFVDDDLNLQSDGAVINFGVNAEIQLTHVHDVGLLLTETGGGAPTIQFRDSAISVSSSADATLDLAADGDINLTAGVDINIPANVGLTFGNDAEKIEGDGTDLTIAGNNINLTAVADIVVPANVGITFGTGEKIEGNNTDITITSGADINLTATADINVPSGVGITFGDDGEKIEGDGTDLTINASNDLNLTAATDINIPANVGLTFGDDGEKIEGDGTNLAINSSGDVNITATTVDLDGNLEVSGTITLGSGAVISEAELELLDGVTAGTAIASKVVTTDANIDTTGQRNLTITGVATAASVVVDNITVDGNTISTTDTNGNLIITPNGTGNVNINSDTLAVSGAEGESAALVLNADEADDNADTWRIASNTGNTLTIENQISGSAVSHLTITPNATVANSTFAVAGGLTTGGTVTATGTSVFASLDISGDIDVDGTTNLDATNIVGDLSVTGDTTTFSSANAEDPLIIIKDTTNDANAARLRFVKDKGAAGADDDDIGTIEFFADNDAQEQTKFALIRAEVADASDGTEGGKLRLQIASHDGEMQNGLIITDGNAEDEIDVTIGSGTSSLTTIAGDMAIPNGAIAIGQSSLSGGSVLADFHSSGSGAGAQLAFANDHNTDKFFVGLAGNTTGNAFLYQQKDANIEFYTNNSLKATLDNNGNLGIGGAPNVYTGYTSLTLNHATNGGILDLELNGTVTGELFVNSSGFHLYAPTSDDDITFRGNDGGSGQFTALTLDMSQAGEADFNSAIKVSNQIVAHQTNKGVLEYNSNITRLRSYGASSGTGELRFQTGGGGGSADSLAMTINNDQQIGLGTADPRHILAIEADTTGAIPTNADMGASNENDNYFSFHNASNSATFSGFALETRTSGASKWLIANEWQSTYLGDLVFRVRDGGTSSSEAMRIDNSGNVGIGVVPDGSDWNASSTLLHLYQNSTNGALLKLESSNTSVVMAAGNNQLQLGTIEAQPFNFYTSGTERMRIDSSGNVTINNDSNDSDFTVKTDNSSATLFVHGQYDGVGIHSSSPISYANAQAVLFIEDNVNPAIGISDTGQTRDYWIYANGNKLGIDYGDGSNTGGVSNETQMLHLHNDSDGAVFNEGGADRDFRVEASEPYAFFIHGGDSSVQMGGASAQTVGTLAPGRLLLLNDNNSHPALNLFRQDTSIGAGGNLGEIVAYSNDTADNDIMPVCKIEFAADGAFGSTDNPSKIGFFTTPNNSETIREAVRIDNVGNLKMMLAGKGIDFSSSQTSTSASGASTSSEVFDHYEEGTWTPVITPENGSAAGITVNHATYTKVGRLVSLVFDVTIDSISGTGSSNAIELTGMPFNSATSHAGGPNIAYGGLTGSMTGTLALSGYSTSKYRIVNLDGSTALNASDHLQASSRLEGQFTYHA